MWSDKTQYEQILKKSLISQTKSKLHTVERETGHNIQKKNKKRKLQSTQLLKLILKIDTTQIVPHLS